ncbi:MAG: N-acetyl-gamma-glutamyl-phosphate reductase [Planctomycetaceae bacterium]|nr:N-acetyl-gamma-glutamyl-phosphate reductase [Planctomycetaceae bacterium]
MSTKDAIPVVIFGARSFTAGELLRLLAGHPKLYPGFVVSRTSEGAKICELQPHLEGWFDDVPSGNEEQAFEYLGKHTNAAVVLCVGNAESAPIVMELKKRGLLDKHPLVDLTGDFRLKSAETYEQWYEGKHPAPELLARFDYCIPELHRKTCKSKLVANPGCFASAVQFACAPALRADLIEPDIRVSAVTGSSGSGASPKPNTHHPTRAHEFYAYKPLTHQHTPEILQGLGLEENHPFALVTHSAPIVRGISVTAMFRLKKGAKPADFHAAYKDFAASEPMVSYSDSPPTLTGVTGTNWAKLSTAVEGNAAVAFCALDNLTRGASGQALQNLNRILGMDETLGLKAPGMRPI